MNLTEPPKVSPLFRDGCIERIDGRKSAITEFFPRDTRLRANAFSESGSARGFDLLSSHACYITAGPHAGLEVKLRYFPHHNSIRLKPCPPLSYTWLASSGTGHYTFRFSDFIDFHADSGEQGPKSERVPFLPPLPRRATAGRHFPPSITRRTVSEIFASEDVLSR